MTSDQTAQPSSAAAPLEYDPASGTFHTRYEPAGDLTPSAAVVDAIATIEASDPCDLPTTLYERIDPDALDALFRPLGNDTARSAGRLEFAFATYDVCIHADGRIAIRSRQR